MTYALLGGIEPIIEQMKTDITRMAAAGTPESPIRRAWQAEPGVFGAKFPAQVIAGYQGRGQKPGIIRGGYIPRDIALTLRWYSLGIGAKTPNTVGWERAEAETLSGFGFFTNALDADPDFRSMVREYSIENFESGAADRMGNPFIETIGRGQINYLWRTQALLRATL